MCGFHEIKKLFQFGRHVKYVCVSVGGIFYYCFGYDGIFYPPNCLYSMMLLFPFEDTVILIEFMVFNYPINFVTYRALFFIWMVEKNVIFGKIRV